MRLDAIEVLAEGKVLVRTPPDHKTGATSLILDPLDFIQNVANQIPDLRMHMVRYYGAYSNRGRRHSTLTSSVGHSTGDEESALSSGEKKSRASWARMLRKIFEVEPLLCPKCQILMKIVAAITKPEVIDRILKHRREAMLENILEARPPPQ